MPWDHLAAVFQSCFHRMLDAAAAGHFHADDCHGLDVILRQDVRELFGIVAFIQLGAANQGYFIFYKINVKICICICSAVGGNQKACIFKIRGCCRNKLDLYRPLI